MPNLIIPEGTRIFLQDSISAEQSLTAVSEADPAVMTYEGADPANGSYVLLQKMSGMGDFDGSVIKVANVNAAGKTFEAKDQDSSDYGTFISGAFQPVTFNNELMIPTGFSTSGGEAQFANYNLLWSKKERQVFTHLSAVSMALPVLFDPADPNHKLLTALAKKGSPLAVKLVFPVGIEMLCYGSVGGSGLPKVQARNVTTSDFSLSPIGELTYVLP